MENRFADVSKRLKNLNGPQADQRREQGGAQQDRTGRQVFKEHSIARLPQRGGAVSRSLYTGDNLSQEMRRHLALDSGEQQNGKQHIKSFNRY